MSLYEFLDLLISAIQLFIDIIQRLLHRRKKGKNKKQPRHNALTLCGGVSSEIEHSYGGKTQNCEVPFFLNNITTCHCWQVVFGCANITALGSSSGRFR